MIELSDWDGLNVLQECEPLGENGGMTPAKFWKLGCLRMHFVRFEGSVMWKQAAWKENLKVWILLKPLNFRMDFFGAETSLCMQIYSLTECHYLKRTKIEVKLKIRIFHWVCCSKQWWSAVLIIMIFH